jgi:hypothetical protein
VELARLAEADPAVVGQRVLTARLLLVGPCVLVPGPDPALQVGEVGAERRHRGGRPGRAPQVEVKDALQLSGRRQRHELAAILKPASLDDPLEQLGRQPRDDAL